MLTHIARMFTTHEKYMQCSQNETFGDMHPHIGCMCRINNFQCIFLLIIKSGVFCFHSIFLILNCCLNFLPIFKNSKCIVEILFKYMFLHNFAGAGFFWSVGHLVQDQLDIGSAGSIGGILPRSIPTFRGPVGPLPRSLAPPAPGHVRRAAKEAPELSWASMAVALVFGGVTSSSRGPVGFWPSGGLSIRHRHVDRRP